MEIGSGALGASGPICLGLGEEEVGPEVGGVVFELVGGPGAVVGEEGEEFGAVGGSDEVGDVVPDGGEVGVGAGGVMEDGEEGGV